MLPLVMDMPYCVGYNTIGHAYYIAVIWYIRFCAGYTVYAKLKEIIYSITTQHTGKLFKLLIKCAMYFLLEFLLFTCKENSRF